MRCQGRFNGKRASCRTLRTSAQIPTRLPHTLAPMPESSLPLSLRLDNCLTHIEHLHTPKTHQTRKVCTRRWVTSLANVATTSLAAGLCAATRHAAITLPLETAEYWPRARVAVHRKPRSPLPIPAAQGASVGWDCGKAGRANERVCEDQVGRVEGRGGPCGV